MSYVVQKARLFSYEHKQQFIDAEEKLVKLMAALGVDEYAQKQLWNLHACLIQDLITLQGDGELVMMPLRAAAVSRPHLRLVSR